MPAQEKKNLFNGYCVFVKGIVNLNQAPAADLPEVAFFGRSNVGKSSLLNTLVNRKNLVKVSNTPGKTKEINFFNLANKLILADLPGYGFAKVNNAVQKRWGILLTQYLKYRENLQRVFLLIDSLVGFKDTDLQTMDFLDYIGRSYSIVLTKSDKKQAANNEILQQTQLEIRRRLAAYPSIIITSTQNKSGIEKLQQQIIGLIS